jgi:hypothetical protein
LLDRGYYKDKPTLIPSQAIFTYEQNDTIAKLANKFSQASTFNASANDASHKIKSYIKQFARITILSDKTINSLLDLLDKVTIPTRSDITRAIKNNIAKASRENGCGQSDFIFCTIGNLTDSSSHFAYYFNDISTEDLSIIPKNIRDIKTDITKSPSKSIFIIEDAFYSGIQIISMLQEILGIPRLKRRTTEYHGGDIDQSIQQHLRANKIYLSYCFANADKEEHLKSELCKLGLNISILCDRHFPAPYFTASHENSDLHDIFRPIGEQILRSIKTNQDGELKPKWNEKRIEFSALGYNDAQQLLVWPWNTPTYTITALWQGGLLEDGFKWQPLFGRKKT